MAEGREIHLGALVFVADDSAWLREAPLDVDALPALRVSPLNHLWLHIEGLEP